MNWKKSSIFCISFLTVFFGEIVVNIACGGEIDPYDYYISYFHNDVQGKEYSQFNFTDYQYLYHEEESVDEYDLNSAEWAKYLKAKKEDVREVMYGSKALPENLDEKNIRQLPQEMQQNTFVKALAKNKDALKYFAFALRCEPLATVSYDAWNPVERDTAQLVDRAEEALKQLEEVKKDRFLKIRYAYQAMRMYRYAENYEACKAVYKQYVAPTSSTDLAKGWAMAVYAGAVRYSGNPIEAAYLFAKVFNSNPERRVQAYKNFHYTSATVNEVLPFAKNNEEKAHIWAIASFGNPSYDLNALEKVYANVPNSLMNGTLLVREVNKLEKNLNTPAGFIKNYYDEEDEKNKDEVRKANLQQLELTKAFALKLASDKKYPEPELGIISAAYLNWLKKDDLAAASLLKQLNPATLAPRYGNQYQLINLLINARKIKQKSTFNANELLPTLKWLDEKCKIKQPVGQDDDLNSSENRYLNTARNFYQELLVPTYMKMGDTARAALLMLKGDVTRDTAKTGRFSNQMSWNTLEFWRNYLSAATLTKLEKKFAKTNEGTFDAFLQEDLQKLNRSDFYELLGTAYLREHQYQKALKCFDKLSPQHEFTTPEDWYGGGALYANPFITTLNDYPKQFTSKIKTYNKKTFAKEMLRLEKLIVSDKKNAAQYYFKMANGVYQTGYFGNSWIFISYVWSSYSINEKPIYIYDNDFKLAKTAKKWYLKARSLSTDPEFRAKCTFMLAKCEQKQKANDALSSFKWYHNEYSNRINQLHYLNRNNIYFSALKQHYANTAYFKKVGNECSYLSDFLASK
ncbi:hypothetical protein [Pedobacter nanyangensis]|uniref:hypothetical protein n=1 Tax=Pedobacter nanyangensis TaxID=1562389 RepID=UPI000DE35895|nr:hypothetical protein [Pedobacter nanyangensis]